MQSLPCLIQLQLARLFSQGLFAECAKWVTHANEPVINIHNYESESVGHNIHQGKERGGRTTQAGANEERRREAIHLILSGSSRSISLFRSRLSSITLAPFPALEYLIITRYLPRGVKDTPPPPVLCC